MATQEQAARYLILQAVAAGEARDFQATVRLLTEAIQLAPRNAEAYHNRGLAYNALQRWPEAVADFTQALDLDLDASSYGGRGYAHYGLGNVEAARRDWEEAVRMAPDDPTALRNLGWLYVEQHRYREAVDLLTRAIARDPLLAAAYANRARAYQAIGDAKRAFDDMQQARALLVSSQDTSQRRL